MPNPVTGERLEGDKAPRTSQLDEFLATHDGWQVYEDKKEKNEEELAEERTKYHKAIVR